MLASSPPSPLSKNGTAISMHAPFSSSSPKQTAPVSHQKATKPEAHAEKAVFNVGRPPIANYQNASTQYSPAEDSGRQSPVQILAQLGDNTYQDTTKEPSSNTSAVLEMVSKDDPSTLTTAQLSPTTRRRQFNETLEPGPGSSVATSYPPKRTKASKKTAKILPVQYEHCEVEDMVILIANMISELIETNDNLPLRDVVLTRFHSRTPPGISVIDYLQRLAKHATLSPPLLLSMVYYIDRLCLLYPAFSITSLTVHRFLIAAATVAAKGLSDSFWNNSTYARVGGIKLAELGLLELEFLYRLDWRIVPLPELLVDYYRGLIARSEDYALEGDVSETVSRQEAAEENQNAEEDESGNTAQHASTDSKWDKWMQDVADSSRDPRAE